MKPEAILFLLSIHEGNELRDQLPGSAYDELASAGLLDGTDITEKGYAYVRLLCDVPEPVQTWADPRSFASDKPSALFPGLRDADGNWYTKPRSARAQLFAGHPYPPPPVITGVDVAEPGGDRTAVVRSDGNKIESIDVVPAGYQPNPGKIPGGVDRAADIQIVRANGKRKTLPAQSVNWADTKTQDRVVGWRYAAAAGEGRIHTPGETMPAPDA